jgi:hypothetical protein
MLRRIWTTPTTARATYYRESNPLYQAANTLFPGTRFNEPPLNTAPNGYAEGLIGSARMLGIAVDLPATGSGGSFVTDTAAASISVFILLGQTRFPGTGVHRFAFSGADGSFIERSSNIAGLQGTTEARITQARDGSLWASQTTLLNSSLSEIVPRTWIAGSVAQPAAFFGGATTVNLGFIDRAQGIAVAVTNLDAVAGAIGVYNATTGALVRRIVLGDTVTSIAQEDASRVFVSTDTGLLHSLDINTGAFYSTIRSPAFNATTTLGIVAWDRVKRNLIIYDQGIDAADGSHQGAMSAYLMNPLGTYLTRPIPLQQIRAGRTSKVYMRLVGDAGEGIQNGRITFTATNAALSGSPPSTDGDGEAFGYITPTTAGLSTVLSATTTVPDPT